MNVKSYFAEEVTRKTNKAATPLQVRGRRETMTRRDHRRRINKFGFEMVLEPCKEVTVARSAKQISIWRKYSRNARLVSVACRMISTPKIRKGPVRLDSQSFHGVPGLNFATDGVLFSCLQPQEQIPPAFRGLSGGLLQNVSWGYRLRI